MRRLEGKVAIITGGASGIGEYTAKLFTKNGARVIVADIQDDLGQALCKELGPNSATYVHCDVTNEAHVQKAVDYTLTKYGKLDIMYNNAGTVEHFKTSILDNSISDFHNVVNVNLAGPFLGTKHATRAMIPARQGSIITTASACSIIAGMAPHSYTSSKHGVVGLMKNTAVELGKYGIRVNCVSPHIVSTPLSRSILGMDDEDIANKFYSNMKGSWCKVEDVGHAALFLASEDSKFISGHNIMVDGGLSIMNAGLCIFNE